MSSTSTKVSNCISYYRYELLGIVLLVLSTKSILNGQWSGDFFEHAAVIKELSINPINPLNPIIGTNAPHAFFSPYTLSLGVLAKLLRFDAITALSIAAIANLILLLFSIKFFIQSYYGQDQRKVAFYALVFILFLWGRNPWWYSGFLHMDVLFYVLPYPSTFSLSAGFFSLSIFIGFLRTGNIIRGGIAITSLAIGLISHPPTILPFFIVIFFLSVSGKFSAKDISLHFSIIILSIALALCWPYYSLLDLLSNSNSGLEDFNSDSLALYQGIVPYLLPLIFLFPLIFFYNFRQNQTLIYSLFTTMSIYFYGYCFESWGLGRAISISAIILQIILASHAASLEDKLIKIKSVIPSFLFSFFIILLLCKKFYYPIINMIETKEPFYSKFKFLSQHTPQYDVVLSDLETSFYVPAFGGKVIASPHPLHFIEDHPERRRDLQLFFTPYTPFKERERIINLYSVKYILLSNEMKNRLGNEAEFFDLGKEIYTDKDFYLLEVIDSK